MSMTTSPANSVASGDRPAGKTLVLVSHTHWDREWYLTFQQYRFKLVRLIDRLLSILENDSQYSFFMLDGQTIVLEDYLEVRPERRADLERHIRSGRLLVGPWYILADQFLVSGESHIQNLLRGLKLAAEFGQVMKLGYVPDPFGHTGQMPQLLRGFDIDSAVFWRGVGPEIGQVEFVWVAPDGTTVDGVHLPGNANIGGYSSALAWNSGPEAALAQLKGVQELIINKARSNIALLMNGNDHVEPAHNLPATLEEVRKALAAQGKSYELIHGTLPMYLEMARQSGIWQQPETPRHVGEFRDSRLAHLLPGVTSVRMWIKQWNAKVEHLLERETGAALAWAASLPVPPADYTSDSYYDPASLQALYRTAWKYLLQNHPHDSICGCSIDQVHEEMRNRFAAAEQIGDELKQEGWRSLARAIQTSGGGDKSLPVIIFNPVPLKRNEVASLSISAPEGMSDPILTDAAGTPVPHRLSKPELEMLFNMDIPAFALAGMASQGGDEGRVMDYTMASFEFTPNSDPKVVDVKVLGLYQSAAPTDPALMKRAMEEVEKYIASGIETFRLSVFRQTGARLEFLANNLPANGYKTFYLRSRAENEPVWQAEKLEEAEPIENEFYELSVDSKTGLFTILDKETGLVYSGLNRFRDGSDAGDEYNYSPAPNDQIIDRFFAAPEITVRRSALESSIEVNTAMELPYSLTDDRQGRSTFKNISSITVVATLVPGQRRIDFETSFDNKVEDHRLQVVFPAPFKVTSSFAEQAFDVVERPVDLPKFDSNWREDPVPTAPQKTFVSIYDPEKKAGLTVINRGLPEYEILPAEGENGSAIAITLLRCVGWLSRSDLATRRDHAGPGLATPGAQMRGVHYFQYSVMPHRGDWLQAGAQQQAHAFNHPLTGIVAAVQPEGVLPDEGSFMEILPRAVALSTVKPGEDGQSQVVRLWNPATRDIPEAKVRFYRKPARVALVNLLEETVIQELAVSDDGWWSFPLPAKRIATLKIEF
ncbi:MAG TPA: glycoside hydrolase family 38 C-terminal domain-containing protein [Chloroflexia bacterium]|nr:glycoside hydrolase family 38 C-terminal domain-containing protein [Chloroflexia bacterium]